MKQAKTKHYLLLLIMGVLTTSHAFSNTKCFLAEENNSIIKQEGDSLTRHSPCSTFKIAISLMGYQEGILTDETHPEITYEEKYGPCFLDVWKQTQTPLTWIRYSCVWYSQVITQKLGMDKFKKYITEFKYGNQDPSGDLGKDNGLIHCWLSSSLKISPQEQVAFLEKLLASKLPVSNRSQEMTRKILYIGELNNGWQLYGKTGSGLLEKPDGSYDPNLRAGWFVGWMEKGDRKIVFAHYIEDTQKMPPAVGDEQMLATSSGARARDAAKEKLKELAN